MKDYCAGCRILLAPFEPEVKKVGNEKWHQSCLDKRQKQKEIRQLYNRTIGALIRPDIKLLPITFK